MTILRPTQPSSLPPATTSGAAPSTRARQAEAPADTPTVEPGAQVLGELARDVIGAIVDLFSPDEGASSAPVQPPPSKPRPTVQGIDTKAGVPAEALRVQAELADTRAQLGEAMSQQAQLSKKAEGDGVLAGANDARGQALEAQIKTLRDTLGALEETEAAQPREDVERARFEVFLDRFDALERSRGPEVAGRLARQAWYNDRQFNLAGGSARAGEAELLATGFPPSPFMRAPTGEQIDMGHVTCALDWQLNPSPTHDLLVDLEQVTLTGDLAAAAQHLAAKDGAAEAALEAQAGRADLLGDLDGLNLAARIRANPGTDVGALLRDYYATGSDADRMDEFASHSSLFKRDASGAAQRDEAGRWVLDGEQLAGKVRSFATRLALIEYGADTSALGKLPASVDAILAAWTAQEQLALG